MASPVRTIEATCLCGAAKHEINLRLADLPLKGSMCHCTSCRHMTGTLCLLVAGLPKDYKPSNELVAKLKPYPFSKRIIQYHCPICGTQMLARCLENGDDEDSTVSWDVSSGILAQSEGAVAFDSHGHVEDTLDGGFSDFLPTIDERTIPRWPHDFDEGEQLPPNWHSPDRPAIEPSPDSRLHGHCKCNGVSFYIARPSAQSLLCKSSWPDLIVPFNSASPPPPPKPWWIRESQDGSKKFLAGLCACNSCRLASGMEVVQWAFIPAADITLDAEGSVPFSRSFGTLKAYRSSETVVRYHCDTCGAMVFFTADERPELIDVPVGLLDAPEGARAESWLVWEHERLSYREDALHRAKGLVVGIEAGLEAYGKRHDGA